MDRISSVLDARTLWRPMTADVCRVKLCTGFRITAALTSRISGTRRLSKLKTHENLVTRLRLRSLSVGLGEEGGQTELIIARRGREYARSTPVGHLETHVPTVASRYPHSHSL